ncbi:MAG: 3-deoxy-D-manno-octulosonic acid transferase [Deltaproteobacteria bacterium]|nr:3-deoxy-D-manno-octulosonic acid transferase [Deltaproteobacteria bacterium]
MFLFLYNFAWTLVVILTLPILSLSKGHRLPERLGLRLTSNPSRGRSIWIHALSVGEVISAMPLARAIKSKYPSRHVIFTVKTEQGMKVALKELSGEVDELVPMPVDFWWSVSRIYHYIRPSVLILVEGDIWPGLLCYLEKRGVKILLVNGRISPRTGKHYRRFGFIVRRIFNRIELCLMQSKIDRERLIKIGIDPHKVNKTGNIKFDRAWRPMEAEERKRWQAKLKLQSKEAIWLAGSTHEGENEIILETFKRLKEVYPGLYLIIAPRRIESAGSVYRVCTEMGLDAVLRSELYADTGPSSRGDVLILDTIGELERIYGLARVSFVGGSMVPLGGHNLLEPASFGQPVLFGEYTYNFQLMSRDLEEAGGGWRVKNSEDLFVKMKILLSDNELLKGMGQKAREFVLKNSGAMDRVMAHLKGYIKTDD